MVNHQLHHSAIVILFRLISYVLSRIVRSKFYLDIMYPLQDSYPVLWEQDGARQRTTQHGQMYHLGRRSLILASALLSTMERR